MTLQCYSFTVLLSTGFLWSRLSGGGLRARRCGGPHPCRQASAYRRTAACDSDGPWHRVRGVGASRRGQGSARPQARVVRPRPARWRERTRAGTRVWAPRCQAGIPGAGGCRGSRGDQAPELAPTRPQAQGAAVRGWHPRRRHLPWLGRRPSPGARPSQTSGTGRSGARPAAQASPTALGRRARQRKRTGGGTWARTPGCQARAPLASAKSVVERRPHAGGRASARQAAVAARGRHAPSRPVSAVPWPDAERNGPTGAGRMAAAPNPSPAGQARAGVLPTRRRQPGGVYSQPVSWASWRT